MENKNIQDFSADYIDSFNAAIKNLPIMVKYIRPCEIKLDHGDIYGISIEQISIRQPKWSDETNRLLYPWECRRGSLSYEGDVYVNIAVAVNGVHRSAFPLKIGSLPIMVKSNLCNIANIDSKNLIKHNEEDDELGGYFIVKGNQVMMRYIVQTRRNFPILKYRESKDKKMNRTGHQISMLCVREDETIAEIKILWKTNAAPDIGLQINKKTFFIPLPYILKALQNKSPYEMFEDIPKTDNNISLIDNLCMMLEKFNAENTNFHTDISCLAFLGHYFRTTMRSPEWHTNVQVGKQILDDFVAIHLKTNKEKYDILLMMLLKLQTFVKDSCAEESFDTLNMQDILTSGSMYTLLLKKDIENFLSNIVKNLDKVMRLKKSKSVEDAIRSSFKEKSTSLSNMNYFMATGNIRNGIIVGIKQSTGLRIMIDNINFYRYVANFRAFHRGAFFTTMKTSSIRRLLPESWGFVCPVHTPDGTPCGLLNHFSVNTKIQTRIPLKCELDNLDRFLYRYIKSIEEFKHELNKDKFINVLCDGRLMGYIDNVKSKIFSKYLRKEKVFPSSKPIPSITEIVLINKTHTASQYPGLYIFTSPGRILRPVYNIMFEKPVIEYIGTFEQTYLDIACLPGNLSEGGDVHAYTTHVELSPQSFYSFTAGFTPYQNYNPSPRNLYQCQMSKQSMGFTYYTTKYRSDNKLYCFLNPQIPLTRSKLYDSYDMKKRPLGYNPIVAVTSYTGYDMEDAMVINKNSLQRGMGRCCFYKHYTIDLNQKNGDLSFLGCGETEIPGLDFDGLPAIGQILLPGKMSPIYAHFCPQTRQLQVEYYKEKEVGSVIDISLNGSLSSATICVKLERNASIGDKFASRHGQKGINSLQVPMIDLPYNEDGITPDQLFNPHGFPSRMTMGKIIEFISGKLAALSATVIDCTAFQQGNIVSDYVESLTKHFFDGMGNERLQNGYTGRMIDSEINMGVIYYQRLRHLVQDKYQVRSVGKIDITTRQPVKGKKLGGGIRLGEMERDCLLSHGAVHCLQDRMVESSSDKITVHVCGNCKSFIHSYFKPTANTASWITQSDRAKTMKNSWLCRMCESDSMTSTELMDVNVPAVTRHLFHELATMNIRVILETSPVDQDIL